jgi:hypothetical protein
LGTATAISAATFHHVVAVGQYKGAKLEDCFDRDKKGIDKPAYPLWKYLFQREQAPRPKLVLHFGIEL